MSELTIEQLKSLEVGDWVWIEAEAYGKCLKGYYQILDPHPYISGIIVNDNSTKVIYDYASYSKGWVAYKNKEQAEAKGEIVELPCKVGDWVYIIDNDRHWAKIDTIRIHNENNGEQKIVFEWVQYDIGVDITELWDSDEFDIEEFGKRVLLESIHGEQIKELKAKEEAEYEAYETKVERRLAELTEE